MTTMSRLGYFHFFRTKSEPVELKSRQFILRLLMLICIFFISFGLNCHGATYYVDFAGGSDVNSGKVKSSPWKRCPGMTGFSGTYTHQPGDVFVFKGGVVWQRSTDAAKNCFPFNIAYSGVVTNPDVYQSDRTWFSGPAWTHPIFDGQSSLTGASTMLASQRKANYILDSIKIINTGASGSAEGGRPIQILYPENVTIRNCIIEPYAHHAILVMHYGDSGKGRIYIHGNDFSHCTNSIEINGGPSGGAPMEDIQIYGNTFHDMKDMTVNGDHGDGIHMYGPEGSLRRVRIYNNLFYGDWGSGDGSTLFTAQIYFGAGVDDAIIYNNVLSFDNSTASNANYMFSPGMLVLLRSRNIKVYNNTISSDALFGPNSGGKSGIVLDGSTGVEIRNNIISKQAFGIMAYNGAAFTADNNLYSPRSGGSIGWDTAQGRTSDINVWNGYGYDANGLIADPLFVNAGAPPLDLRLGAYSPAKGQGQNFSSIFTYDLNGRPRSNAAWDMGAYAVSILNPRNLRITN